MANYLDDFQKRADHDFKDYASKYYFIAGWVAIVLNPIWGISDYYNCPSDFGSFMTFRLVVTLIIFSFVFLRKRYKRFPELLPLIIIVGISIQNAFMYSRMNTAEFQNHTFAYIALFVGAGMFILWDTIYSVIVVAISIVANAILFWIYSPLSFHEIIINGGLLTTSVSLFSIVLIYTRTNLTKKTITAQLALADNKRQLEIKNAEIEEKNQDISDSINYAQRIQQAIFPPLSKIDTILNDYFILFQPKDIVSGDFYWLTKVRTTPNENSTSEEVIVVAAVDCTGHGVPGALMSIIGSSILNQSITEPTVNSPSEALSYLDKQLTNNLHSINDGMDIALCSINPTKLELQYAGANNPLYIVRGKELIEIKPDKKPIGGNPENFGKKVFENHSVKLEKNDCIYLFSDGYADQFGGETGKKLKYKNFQNLLIEMYDLPMKIQHQKLIEFFTSWKGNLNQVDDVLVIGIRV